MSDRLQEIIENKRASTARFRGLQHSLGAFGDRELIYGASPETREGTIELHKGIHWINLELYEFLSATKEERPEEIADVLHFIAELILLLGFDHTLLGDYGDPSAPEKDRLDLLLDASLTDAFVFPDPDTNARFAILAALSLANDLKNKPWKQTLRPAPDRDSLIQSLRNILYWYGATVRTQGMSSKDLYDQFMRKEKINADRVATGV